MITVRLIIRAVCQLVDNLSIIVLLRRLMELLDDNSHHLAQHSTAAVEADEPKQNEADAEARSKREQQRRRAAGVCDVDAVWFQPTLMVVSGAIAAISDAVARRGSEEAVNRSSHEGVTVRLPTELGQLLAGDIQLPPPKTWTEGERKRMRFQAQKGRKPTYAVGVGAFAHATARASVASPELVLARTAVLDYFDGLKVKPQNELFNVESPSFYGSDECPTLRFFRRLGDTVYSDAKEGAMADLDMSLEGQSPDICAFRDIMLHWKRFTLTGPARRRPSPPTGTGTHSGRLLWQGGVAAFVQRYFHEDEDTARPGSTVSAAEASYYTAPRPVCGEEDVLHLRRLPLGWQKHGRRPLYI